MAIIRKEEDSPRLPLNVARVQRAVFRIMNFEYAFFNTYYHKNTEADLLLISKARYATEVEIKLNLSDVRADFKKKKLGLEFIKYFYYAFPVGMLEKALPLIPKERGIILISEGDFGVYKAEIYRQSESIGNQRFPKDRLIRIFYNLYYKHNSLWFKHQNQINEKYLRDNHGTENNR